MAQLTLDLSGMKGLLERHQGDLNDTAAQPQFRYLGADGQMAEGFFNPFKKLGFLSPTVGAFESLTGTISGAICSFVYDSADDILYMAEEGDDIRKLDGLDDTSIASYITITSGDQIKDMVLYEINGNKALLFAIDSGTTVSATNKTGSYVGFKMIDTDDGISILEKDVNGLSSGRTTYSITYDAGATGSLSNRKYGQSFSSSDLTNLYVTGVEIAAQLNSVTTPASVTLKVSIQTNSAVGTAPYTNKGAWTTATSYVINDIVSSGGLNYHCYVAHTSGAANQPTSGGAWEDFWSEFKGAPSGTELASGTITADNIPEDDTGQIGVSRLTTVTFSSPVTLTTATMYWIVIEESTSTLISGDTIELIGTTNGNGIYSGQTLSGYVTSGATDYWKMPSPNGNQHETIHFSLLQNFGEDWSKETANGAFEEDTGVRSFLHLSENGLVYWAAGNRIHTLDGSLTGGPSGRVNEAVLQFPEYMVIADIAETRSRMYIGLQSSKRDIPTGLASINYKHFPAGICGVYVWDKRSQVVGGSDFISCPGAMEIKSLFRSYNGSIMAITISNSGFSELRALNGNQFEVVQTFETTGFPRTRRAVTELYSTMTVWLGANGFIYAYGKVAPGEPAALYKIGNFGNGVATDYIFSAIFAGDKYSTNPRTALLFTSQISGATTLKRWFPNGQGTLNSVAQTSYVGEVFTKVNYIPPLSTVREITIYCSPTTTSTDSTIATINLYFNHGSQVAMAKTITDTEAAKGYVTLHVNKHNINSVQLGISYPSRTITGSTEFQPSVAIATYEPTGSSSPDNG